MLLIYTLHVSAMDRVRFSFYDIMSMSVLLLIFVMDAFVIGGELEDVRLCKLSW